MSTERIIVQRSIAEKFREALQETAKTVLPGVAPSTYLAMAPAVGKNKQLISDAVSKGAKVLFGEGDGNPFKGNIQPTIIEGVTPDMTLYKTESFGPIATLHVVDTEEEAIALANDTEYGLTAAVFTEDLRRGLRVARQVESGYVLLPTMRLPIYFAFTANTSRIVPCTSTA